MHIKAVLFVVLSLFMLAGCGYNEMGSPNRIQDEPRSNELQESGPRDNTTDEVNDEAEVVPSDGEDSLIGDDNTDMPDGDGHGMEKNDTNK